MNLEKLRSMGYSVGHDNEGGLRVSGPKPTAELTAEIKAHKQDLLTELFGKTMREAGPPFPTNDLTDLELGEYALGLMGEVMQNLGHAREEK